MTSLKDKVASAFRMSPKSSRPSFRSYVADDVREAQLAEGSGVTLRSKPDHKAEDDETSDEIDVETDTCDGHMNGKTYSYEAGLSDMNPFSKFRRESYYLSMKENGDSRMTDRSSGISIDYRVHENLLAKPIESVFRYSLNSKRAKGSIGRLVLTNVRLKFMNYNESSASTGQLLLPPFDLHSFMDESLGSGTENDDSVDFLVIHRCECTKRDASPHFLLTVLCSDCRRIEFLLLESEESRSFADTLTKLLSPPSLTTSLLSSPNALSSHPYFSFKKIYELPLVWYMLCTQYSFFEPKDWEQREGYWYLRNPFLRLTQCNEALQVSRSLPKCFVSSVMLSDIVLTQNIAYQLNGQRVPLICFSVPVSSEQQQPGSQVSSKQVAGDKPVIAKKPIHLFKMKDHRLLMRSVPLTEDVSNLMRSSINPLRVFDLAHLLKGLLVVESAHNKLLEAIFNKNTNRFFSLIAKWMKLLSRALRVAHHVVDVLRHESSVVLVEENDRFWNPVVSCLVQLIIDPRRRTVQGFESLLSREWMFFNGYANRYPDSMKSPNHISFVLFIDCVHQMIAFSKNGLAFQFTSIYLIRLFDLQYLPSPFSAANPVRDIMSSFEDLTKIGVNGGRRRSLCKRPSIRTGTAAAEIPLTLDGLSADQLLFLLNPLYLQEERQLDVPQHIANMQFFEGLYLRWHWMGRTNSEYYMLFPMYQEVGLSHVLLQRLRLWPDRRKVSASPTKSSNESYTETEL